MPNSSLPESLKKTVECANMEETQYVWNVAFRGEEEMWRGQTLGWQHRLCLGQPRQLHPSTHPPTLEHPWGKESWVIELKKTPGAEKE